MAESTGDGSYVHPGADQLGCAVVTNSLERCVDVKTFGYPLVSLADAVGIQRCQAFRVAGEDIPVWSELAANSGRPCLGPRSVLSPNLGGLRVGPVRRCW